MFRRAPLFLVLLGALALSGGCGDESTGPAAPGTVVIQFDNVVDGLPLALNQQIYTNAAGNLYSVSNLEYVVSAFHLHPVDHDLGEFESEDPHYRTEMDVNTRRVTFTGVPAGAYHELGFTFGIDGALNMTGAYPDLDLAQMAWPAGMGGGYHNMRCEGTFDGTPPNTGFLTHTGPSMGGDYSIDYDFDVDYEVMSGQTTVLTVEMNVNEWYANPNLYDFNDHTGPIMGNTAVQLLLQQNGVDVFSVSSVTTE